MKWHTVPVEEIVEAVSKTLLIGASLLFFVGWAVSASAQDAKERAFYYVRVLEIPTPRWTTYDAKIFGVKRSDDVPATIQERAYTLPIWYTP